MKKPLIGISAVHNDNLDAHWQKSTYLRAVWNAGGDAIFLPCAPDTQACERLVSLLDGLLVPGGADIDPALYNEEKSEVCGTVNRSEDDFDIALIQEAKKQGKPILAICRGLQIVNVMHGGSLYQDIPTQFPSEINHAFGGSYDNENYHTVKLNPDCHLAKILGQDEVKANTSHHQSIKDVAEGFTVTGYSADGSVESIENSDGSIIAVQWHPERMQDMEIYRQLFKDFIEKCSK